jgi:hypothetical protein
MATENYNKIVSDIKALSLKMSKAASEQTDDIEHGDSQSNQQNRMPERAGGKGDNAGGGDHEAVHGMKDPADKGTASIPVQAAASGTDSSALHSDGGPIYPEDKNPENKDGEVGQDAGTASQHTQSSTGTNPREVLEGSHDYKDGDAADARATAPNTPVSEITVKASSIAQAIADLNKANGQAPAAQPKQASAAGHQEYAAQASNANPNAEFHFKIASTVLGNERCIKVLEEELQKSAGDSAARELITSAVHQEEIFSELGKQAAEQEQAEIEYMSKVASEVDNIYKSASEADRAEMDKVAHVHSAALNNMESEFEKIAYMGSAEDAAAIEDSVAEGGEAALPDEGEVTIEDVAAILDAMVQSGEIDEETAMAILEQFAAGEAGEAAEGDMGAPMGGDMGGEMAAAEDAMGDDAMKVAHQVFTEVSA